MSVTPDLRLSELLAALSLVTDLGMGFPPEHAARNCLLATGLARAMDLPETEVRDVYYTALLKHLGCTAHAHESAWWAGGDEIHAIGKAVGVDFTRPKDAIAHTRGLARGSPPLRRARVVARAMAGGKRWGREFDRAFCEVATHIAERLGLGPSVVRSLNEILERWDGKGGPRGLRGDDIALPARFAQVAEHGSLFDRRGGPEAAVAMVRDRSGRMLDPSIAAAFSRAGPSLLADISAGDPLARVVEAEPEPHLEIAERDIDRVAGAFADVVDLKTPFLQRHSTEVADLAEGASRHLGFSDPEVSAIRRAALLHDLGRVGVPNGTWEKPGPLGVGEWEQVRLHPYHSERILMRAPLLAPLASIAGMHHERSDGSGYYRLVTQAGISMPARVVAAADAFQARTQARPYRAAKSIGQAASEVRAAAEGGTLDADAVTAVLAAAGRAETPPRRHRPAGLSDREVEVLRLLAQGSTTREVARRLFISPKTADHHIQHIYGKIGVSTRAGASLFAMEQGLLAPPTGPAP